MYVAICICMKLCILHYRCVRAMLQVIALQKAAQENSIPHESTQQSSVQQPTVQYAIPNKKAVKNQDQGVSTSLN